MTRINPNKVNDTALRDMVKEALKANQSAESTVKAARIVSAKAAYVAEVTGRIGKAGLWETKKSFAVDLGTSASNLTALVRIGHALSKGYDPEGADAAGWPVLSSKVNNSPTLREVLDDSKATLTEIRKAVDVARGEKSARKAREDDGSGKGDQGEGEGDGVTVTLTPDQEADALVQRLSTVAKDVSADAWPGIENAIQTILAREVTIRTKPTPATVARGRGKARKAA